MNINIRVLSKAKCQTGREVNTVWELLYMGQRYRVSHYRHASLPDDWYVRCLSTGENFRKGDPTHPHIVQALKEQK